MISVSDRPYRYPWFRIVQDREAYVFEYAGSVVRVTGTDAVQLLSALLPHLNGRHTVEEIQQRLGGWEAKAITQALSVLLGQGIITVADDVVPAGEDEHLLTALMGTPEGRKPISRTSVGVAGEGSLADAMFALAERSGVGSLRRLQWSDVAAPLDLVVAAPGGPDLSHLDPWNRLMLQRGQVWLPVVPFDGVYGAVGPLIVPGETACYTCLRIRRRSTLEDPEMAEGYDDRPAYRPMGSALTSLLAGLAVHVALRWITRRDPRIPGMLYAVSLGPQPDVRGHEVHPVPRCPTCRFGRDYTPDPWSAADPARAERAP